MKILVIIFLTLSPSAVLAMPGMYDCSIAIRLENNWKFMEETLSSEVIQVATPQECKSAAEGQLSNYPICYETTTEYKYWKHKKWVHTEKMVVYAEWSAFHYTPPDGRNNSGWTYTYLPSGEIDQYGDHNTVRDWSQASCEKR